MFTIRSCVLCKQKKNTELRCENGTGKKKGRKESFPRTASCASASLQRGEDFPVASKDRSVTDAVPGQEDGKDAVTQDEMQPPKANGGVQILDTWGLTLTSPSSTTSISPSTTSTCVRENAAMSSGRSKGSAVFHIMWRLQAVVPRWTITIHQVSLGKRT